MAACPKAPTCLFFSPLSPFWVPEEAPCCCTAATVTRVASQGLALGADCSESRGLRAQLCARLKLLAEVEAGEREGLSGGCSPRKQPVGAGVGGWLHPGCFPPPWDLRWVWFRGPVPPELLAAIALFNVKQRQDEELA